MSVLQNAEPRFFVTTQDNPPGFGTYETSTVFTGGLSPSAAHTAGLSRQFADTSRRFGNTSSERKKDAAYDTCKLAFRSPGSNDIIPYNSFDYKNSKNSGVANGTIPDSERPLTQARDEREGIAAPGSYNLGSCFDKASRKSSERSGKGSSSFCNSGRQQNLTPDGKNIICMPRCLGLNGEKLGPGSYSTRNKNWIHWRDPTDSLHPNKTFNDTANLRGSTPHTRQQSRYPAGQDIMSSKRRPRRMVGEGETAVRPRTSEHRGTFFGLYLPKEADAHRLQRSIDSR